MVQPSMALAALHAAVQLAGCCAGLGTALDLWLALAAPRFEAVRGSCGEAAAVVAVTAGTLAAVHAIAAALTFPAVSGLYSRLLKVQLDAFPGWRRVLGALPLVAFNALLSVVCLSWLLLLASRPGSLRDLASGLPSPTSLAAEAAFGFVVGDISSYYVHRWLHSKRMYGQVHKLHHQYTVPVALATHYEHPLEHFLQQLVCACLGPLLWGLANGGLHPAVLLSWVLLGRLHVALGFLQDVREVRLPRLPLRHSGFLSADLGAHDLHHERFSVNFGASGLLDLWHGTHMETPCGERVRLLAFGLDKAAAMAAPAPAPQT